MSSIQSFGNTIGTVTSQEGHFHNNNFLSDAEDEFSTADSSISLREQFKGVCPKLETQEELAERHHQSKRTQLISKEVNHKQFIKEQTTSEKSDWNLVDQKSSAKLSPKFTGLDVCRKTYERSSLREIPSEDAERLMRLGELETLCHADDTCKAYRARDSLSKESKSNQENELEITWNDSHSLAACTIEDSTSSTLSDMPSISYNIEYIVTEKKFQAPFGFVEDLQDSQHSGFENGVSTIVSLGCQSHHTKSSQRMLFSSPSNSTQIHRNSDQEEELIQELIKSRATAKNATREVEELKESLSALFAEYNELASETQCLMDHNNALIEQLDETTRFNRQLRESNISLQNKLESAEFELEKLQYRPSESQSIGVLEDCISMWQASEYAIAMGGLQEEMRRKTKIWKAERHQMELQLQKYQKELEQCEEIATKAIRDKQVAEVALLRRQTMKCNHCEKQEFAPKVPGRTRQFSMGLGGYLGDKSGDSNGRAEDLKLAGSSTDHYTQSSRHPSSRNLLHQTWHGRKGSMNMRALIQRSDEHSSSKSNVISKKVEDNDPAETLEKLNKMSFPDPNNSFQSRNPDTSAENVFCSNANDGVTGISPQVHNNMKQSSHLSSRYIESSIRSVASSTDSAREILSVHSNKSGSTKFKNGMPALSDLKNFLGGSGRSKKSRDCSHSKFDFNNDRHGGVLLSNHNMCKNLDLAVFVEHQIDGIKQSSRTSSKPSGKDLRKCEGSLYVK